EVARRREQAGGLGAGRRWRQGRGLAGHQREAGAIGVGEPDDLAAEPRDGRVLQLVPRQAVAPVVEGALWHPQRDLLGARRARVPRAGARPGEEREQAARAAGGVPEVEVVRAGDVVVDRALDHAQADDPVVELDGLLRPGADAGDVMVAERRAWQALAAARPAPFAPLTCARLLKGSGPFG